MRTACVAIVLAGAALAPAAELTGRELALLRVILRQSMSRELHAVHETGDAYRIDRASPLRAVWSEPNVDELHEIMTDEANDPYKQFNAARALAYLGDKRCVDVLAETLAGRFAQTSSGFELSEAAACLLYLGVDLPDRFLFTRLPNPLYAELNALLDAPSGPGMPLTPYPERYDSPPDANLPHTKEQLEQVVAGHFGRFSVGVTGPLVTADVEQIELQAVLNLIASGQSDELLRVPFAGCYDQWQDFKEQMEPGGLLYFFDPGPEPSPDSVILMGYVLIRDGQVVAQLLAFAG
ncbi:MAG: hypothetical protein JW993_09675 [Sedimentisphaerales bacterium]|nr:hypothetical protein [Sedimentisphaerales bacterium]